MSDDLTRQDHLDCAIDQAAQAESAYGFYIESGMPKNMERSLRSAEHHRQMAIYHATMAVALGKG